MRVKQLESTVVWDQVLPLDPTEWVLWSAGDGCACVSVERGAGWGGLTEPGKKMKKNHPGGNLLHCGKKQYYKSPPLLNSAGN